MSMGLRAPLLVCQASATLIMVGVIWLVQVVHYPLFAFADPASFPEMAERHQRGISFVVVPPMLIEAVGALALIFWRPARVPVGAAWLGLVLVVAVWVVTFAVQVPQHTTLLNGFDPETIQALVSGNGWRTALWSTRGVLMVWLLVRLTRP